jgi:hypothetical protein
MKMYQNQHVLRTKNFSPLVRPRDIEFAYMLSVEPAFSVHDDGGFADFDVVFVGNAEIDCKDEFFSFVIHDGDWRDCFPVCVYVGSGSVTASASGK